MKKHIPKSFDYKRLAIPAIISAVGIPSLTLGWNHIKEVWAGPAEVKQIKEDQSTLRKQTIQQGEWIEQSKKETDMRKKAPKGFRYEESIGEYIEWREDPRLKKK